MQMLTPPPAQKPQRRATAAAARAPRAAPAARPNRCPGGSARPLAALLALAACAQTDLSPADRAELDNMWKAYLAPKSTASQMVTAFRDICIETPRKNAEAALRNADYVPLPQSVDGARGWVVDDRRPAVAVSQSVCMVRAKSRTGQTRAFANYIASSFPEARPIDTASLGDDIETAWSVPGPAIVATQRERDLDFFVFSLIYYTPEAAR